MEKLPVPLLLEILSRLDNSADVARCRVAWKAFDSVFPGLRSISLRCPPDWSRVSNSLKTVFLDLISKLESVESLCFGFERHVLCARDDNLFNEDFAEEWLPRVSESLKSLEIYGHNLVNLKLKYAWLIVDNLNPMPMLTSLTLESITLKDANLNEWDKWFPNLQAFNLLGVEGLNDAKINLLHLKTCHLSVFNSPMLSTLTLITPNLITLTLTFDRIMITSLHVEAPMLSHFRLRLDPQNHSCAFTAKKFENLKTLSLRSSHNGSLLSEFPITKTVENLTLGSGFDAPTDLKLTLAHVFTVFPNLSFVCIKFGAWSELEAWPELKACLTGWEIFDERKGLKTMCAYLKLADPSVTFSYVACVLDQCDGLLEVSLLIHADDDDTVAESFKSKCMAGWPNFNWSWGLWNDSSLDTWITYGLSN